MISIYGILKAGATFVVSEASLKHSKLSYILNNCSATVLITHVQKVAVVQEALKNVAHQCQVICVGSKELIAALDSQRSLSWDDIFTDVDESKKSGELRIRGSNVMQGYWNDPDLTRKNFIEGCYPGDRVLCSGDYFRKDQNGYLYFVGRKDDMIKTRGERVNPREIENALCNMEGIAEAAIIGVRDDILGQALRAFIVLQKGTILNEKEIKNYCFSNLETFVIPHQIVILKELPKTPNGKIDKKKLEAHNK